MALRKRRPGLVYPVTEDWHYVGDGTTGLGTTFGAGWSNFSGSIALGFRIRETGVVDIHGTLNVAVPSIFTLPVGYRPSTETNLVAVMSNDTAARVQVDTGGVVDAFYASGSVIYICGQFFLDVPNLAP